MIHRPQDRLLPYAVWSPGQLGPYGAGPPRPSSFVIEDVKEMPFVQALGLIGAFLSGLVAIVIFLLRRVARYVERHARGWTTAIKGAADLLSQKAAAASPARPASVRRQLESIRQTDPDFSVVLLEDFLYALYAEAQTARGQGALARLAPYFQPEARVQLEGLGAHPVSGIVVGALRLDSFTETPQLCLGVEFEANYAEQHSDGARGFYTRESWLLSRNPAARSRPPEKIRTFGCPACGAPLDKLLGGTCQYCNRAVKPGDDDWVVEGIQVLERSSRGPMLTGTVEEEGTGRPTLRDLDIEQQLARIKALDPDFSANNLRARIWHIFMIMQKAWSSLAWEEARPFLTDNLFESLSYWIAAYRAQGLRNVTENAKVNGIDIVRTTRDRWYDAVTVRLFAESKDYTLRDGDGQVVGGNRTRVRRYSEYWTLLRSAGRKGAARTDAACPSCGAPLAVGMTARCQHCQAKVNSGEFDWVLSRIEQDEVYAG
jgi:predicted lipid-binding transport protein (Tim44 family)